MHSRFSIVITTSAPRGPLYGPSKQVIIQDEGERKKTGLNARREAKRRGQGLAYFFTPSLSVRCYHWTRTSRAHDRGEDWRMESELDVGEGLAENGGAKRKWKVIPISPCAGRPEAPVQVIQLRGWNGEEKAGVGGIGPSPSISLRVKESCGRWTVERRDTEVLTTFCRWR